MITLLIIDDQPSVRQGLRMRFALERDLVVIGEAGCATEAFECARRLNPDVALIDIAMPHSDGIAAIRTLRELAPECAVIVLSLNDDPATRERAMCAGAYAFVAKQEPDTLLIDVIRRGGARNAPISCNGSHLA